MRAGTQVSVPASRVIFKISPDARFDARNNVQNIPKVPFVPSVQFHNLL
jgi:hypothetical protein